MMDPNVLWWRSSLKGQTTRRWAFYDLGAFFCPMDTGTVHGPANPLIPWWAQTVDPAFGPLPVHGPRIPAHELRKRGHVPRAANL